jgi:diacylglycerol O-acyltransferase
MSSLLAERGPIHVNVGATIIVSGKPPTFGDFAAHVEKRLNLVPRFRQKVTPDPLGLDNPVWTDDPRFDIDWHLRRVALPEPGGMTELRELAGRIYSEPLDLARPLWQLYLVEGLEGRRHALINKTHHALVDGVSAIDVGTIILDPTKDGVEMAIPEERWDPDEPSPSMLFARAATERIARPIRTARKAALNAVTMPRSTATSVLRTAEAFGRLAAGGPKAPPTYFNQEIGRDRRVAFVETRLDEIKAARTGDATVNDVLLACAAGGIRRYLARHGEAPSQIVGLVPMSIRRPEEQHDLGNRVATLMVPLPIAEADPARRLNLVSAETTKQKESQLAAAASLVIEASGWTPPTINRVLAGAMSRPLNWNLVISNVPGPQVPIYLLGQKLEAIYPFIPLSPQGHALSVGMLSYDGGVFFGLAGDREVLHDIESLAADLREALAEQVAASSPN